MLGGTAMAASKGLIGISMPTKSSARWIADGANLVKSLEQKGYKTDLQYADDDIPNQLAQVENMITKGSKILVRSEEHTSELQSLMRISYAVFCLKKQKR